MNYRIGIGYDIHRLVSGRKLFLGGVEIPYRLGLLGHSNADVLLHAVCDALLGAAALGDIGGHFPDTEKKYKGVSSVELLRATCRLLERRGFSVANIDTVIIAQEPNLAVFKKKIEGKISEVIEIPGSRVNVKAKTHEGLGEIGKKKAIAAYAVALINKEG